MATHYMSRDLLGLGHEVKQVPPAYAKPFRQGHKNDFRDAHAVAEAQRPSTRCVPIKTDDQLDLQAPVIASATVAVARIALTVFVQGRGYGSRIVPYRPGCSGSLRTSSTIGDRTAAINQNRCRLAIARSARPSQAAMLRGRISGRPAILDRFDRVDFTGTSFCAEPRQQRLRTGADLGRSLDDVAGDLLGRSVLSGSPAAASEAFSWNSQMDSSPRGHCSAKLNIRSSKQA
jgi:hypothetical protein